MNYTNTVIINKPIEKVWEVYTSPNKIKEWQPTLQSMDHISGELGQPGSKSLMTYPRGKGTMQMTEIILERRDPEYMKATYETDGVVNLMETHVKETADGKTQITLISDFKFNSLFYKLMGFFGKAMFVKQTQSDLDRLKEVAERS